MDFLSFYWRDVLDIALVTLLLYRILLLIRGDVYKRQGRGVIPYVFKIYASIYLLSFLLAACCEVLYC